MRGWKLAYTAENGVDIYAPKNAKDRAELIAVACYYGDDPEVEERKVFLPEDAIRFIMKFGRSHLNECESGK